MPEEGSKTNKCFTFEMLLGNNSGQQELHTSDVQCAALPDWTQLGILVSSTSFPISWVEIHIMSNKGDGTYQGFDKPVYVDDLTLGLVPAP
jgi:hypothetical protein